MSWTILRPPAVYGPRDVKFLKLFGMATSGLAAVFDGGRQEVSLVYAPDLAGLISV